MLKEDYPLFLSPSQIFRLQIIPKIVLAFLVHMHITGLAFTVAG